MNFVTRYNEKLLCERNTYNSIPIFRDFADVFVHALKMCMWFGHYHQNIFLSYFVQLLASIMKVSMLQVY